MSMRADKLAMNFELKGGCKETKIEYKGAFIIHRKGNCNRSGHDPIPISGRRKDQGYR